jgi:transcriptional regulator with XRE-family HTH domain
MASSPTIQNERTSTVKGDELREWRTLRGLSQTKLGALLGLSGRQIRNYELGACPIPEIVELKLARRRLKVVK